jgi:NTP pyrophosphatase (non-canonical NTP hydrolase)
MEQVLDTIRAERARQDLKWGEQHHHPLEWLSILGEEAGEACKAANEAHWRQGGNWQLYYDELVQVAAVAVAALEDLDRRGAPDRR